MKTLDFSADLMRGLIGGTRQGMLNRYDQLSLFRLAPFPKADRIGIFPNSLASNANLEYV